nr:hypothetical protein [Calditerricola satsumensis]
MEIVRAFALRPKLLLLDEPAAGLNPAERQQLAAVLRQARSRGVTVLLIEHDVDLVMTVADRILVLDQGRVLAEGRRRRSRPIPPCWRHTWAKR